MADYFTNFSLIMPLPDEAAEKYALALAEQAFHIHMGDEIPVGFPASLRDVAEDWQFDTDPCAPVNGCGLWLHSSDGGIDAVCAFIQHLLERFDPSGCVSLEWSNDCLQAALGCLRRRGRAHHRAEDQKHQHRTMAAPPGRPASKSEAMKLHVKPNEESGFWEIHDENGFLCHLESESMAAIIVHAANVLPQLVAFLQAANEAVGNCEESLEGHIEIRGWLADRLPRLIERATNTHP